MSTSAFLKSFFSFLGERADYAVLRNAEGLPERCDSRDIDIVLRRSDYQGLKNELFALVENAGWKVVTYLWSDRLVTWVIGCEEGLLQLDFFFDCSVYGIRLLSAEQLLAGVRTVEGEVPLRVVSPEIEFLDKYLYDRAVGAAYPEKYASVRATVGDSSMVRDTLRTVFGQDGTAACDAAAPRQLLWAAFRREPLENAGRFLRFEYARLRNYFCSDTGFTLGFTGPDGVGKTTVIEGVLSALSKVFSKAHVLYHFRPTLFGNISDVAHSAGLKKSVDDNYSNPHRGGKTGVLSSFLRLCYYTTDYLLGWWIKVKSRTRYTFLVFFDRYYTDIICDSRRSRIYLPFDFLYAWGRLFVPSLDYNILLTASTDTILSRKKELSREEVEAISGVMERLMEKQGGGPGLYLKVTNDGAPEEAVRTILRSVYAGQHTKNRRRILGEKLRWFRIQNADGKAWVLPSRKMRTALCLYQPGSLKGKALKCFLPLLGGSALVRKALKMEEVPEPYPQLQTLFQHCFGRGEHSYAVFEGTPSVHKKVTLQIFRNGKIEGYVKLSDNPAVIALFEHENTILDNLLARGMEGIPRVVALEATGEGTAFVQDSHKTPFSGTPHRWSPLMAHYLGRLEQLTGGDAPFEQTSLCEDLRQTLDLMPEALKRQAEILLSQHRGTVLACTLAHNDFTPWNLYVSGGRLEVFDWEYASFCNPVGLDACHFRVQTALLERRWSPERIVREIILPSGQVDHYRMYLLGMAARYLRRDVSCVTSPEMKAWMQMLEML